ncbi:MAG: multicopper oxidase domain-containing protein [Actinobacteria bacterium]|nr:multicopper oxidase domain-containing protein [Actinomycetota bacterium]
MSPACSGQERPNERDLELGTVAEWTVQNLSDQDHVFHIHTNPFSAVAENGKPLEWVR